MEMPSSAVQASWLDELRDASRWVNHDQWWASEYTVDISLALVELRAWLSHFRPYDNKQKSGWISVISDFKRASIFVGPHLRTALEPELSTLISEVGALPNGLEKDKPAASAVAGSRASMTAEALNAKLCTPTSVAAAWRDVADDCRESATDFDDASQRRDLFWRIVVASGANRREVANVVTGVLGNSASSVHEAKRRLGDTSAPRPSRNENSNLSESEKVELCAQFLAAPPRVGRHVVWLAFDKARIPSMVVNFGAVTFYWGELLKSLVEARKNDDPRFPVELTRADPWFTIEDFAEEPDVVYARVELGSAALHDAPAMASRLAEGAVSIGKFYGGATKNWNAMSGFLHFVDDELFSMSPFTPSFEMPGRDLSIDYTGDEIDAKGQTIGASLTPSNGDMLTVVDAVQLWREASDQQPAAAIAQYVQIIEHIASRVDHYAWYEYLQLNMRFRWIRSNIEGALGETAYQAIHRLDTETGLTAHAKESLRRRVLQYRDGTRSINMLEAVAVLREIDVALSPFTLMARRVRSLVRWLASPATIADRCDVIDLEWELTRARLQRIRNCVAHGGPLSEAGMRSVSAFSRQLAAWSISACISGVADKGIIEEHADRKKASDDWRAGIRSSPNSGIALFPRS
ncbi:hypothetical protein ACFY2Q_07040 [Micromonospora sp. NPDC000316]|uniref:hypothetical protein n=1 Tax=Micromonospora sp. NPDC000316 TaxID=3364216 RepID=UPI00368DB32B